MLFSKRLILVMITMIVLTASTAILASQLMYITSSRTMQWLCWLSFVLICALCMYWIVYIWKRHRLTISRIRGQLMQFEEADRIGMIMVEANDELSELVTEINHYLTNIKFRFEKDHIEHKELQLQANVSETERRQAEAVIYSISDAVVVTNRYDELQMANPAAEDLCDFSMDCAYCLPITDVIKDDELIHIIQQACCESKRKIIRIVEIAHPVTGKTVDLKVTASGIFGHDKERIGVVMVMHDITAEREVTRMKDDFVSSVSHELKTPLSSIKAYAEMLADNETSDTESHKKFCQIIEEQADRLNRLIEDILNMSKIESGIMQIAAKPFDIIETVKEAMEVIRPQAEQKHIGLEISSVEDEMILSADRDMIFQAILNLLINAVKYSPDHKDVRVVTYWNDESQIVVEVHDEGIGMSDESLEHVFDKFYRCPESHQYAGGTGLGLHLVKEIVKKLHNGQVTVKSELDKGSVFTLVLPLCPSLEEVEA